MNAPAWFTVNVSDLPVDHGWLGVRERQILSRLKVPGRRRDWMLGRWAAKRAAVVATAGTGGVSEAEVEVIAASDGAPEAWLGGRPAPFQISLSHCDGLGACLVAGPGVTVGCDVELVEPRAAVFAADWFTDRELTWLAGTPPEYRDLWVTLIWSAKESVLKALRQGLRRDPRDVDVWLENAEPDSEGWRPLAAVNDGHRFEGWWRREGRLVMTAVMDPPGRSPTLVNQSCDDEESL
jgi:4'-phosphopantetheinyl transferase